MSSDPCVAPDGDQSDGRLILTWIARIIIASIALHLLASGFIASPIQ